MANRRFTQFYYTLHKMPVLIDGDILIGAVGAVTSIAAVGVKAVVRLGVGIYQIQLEDNYTNYYGIDWNVIDGATGATVAGGAFVVGTAYQILTMGNTTQAQWIAAGVPVGVTAAVGVSFVALTVGAGTGTVKSFAASGVFAVENLGNPTATLAPLNLAAGAGGYILVTTLNAAGAAANPVAGTVLGFQVYLSNSTSPVNGIN